jgi:hypothetical protein
MRAAPNRLGWTCLAVGLVFSGFLLGFCDPVDAAVYGRKPQVQMGYDLLESGQATGVGLMKHRIEVYPGVYKWVRGKQQRRQVRVARLIHLWQGDRRATYEKHGYPSSRHRETALGRTTEHWTYLATGQTFVFEGDRLLRTGW